MSTKKRTATNGKALSAVRRRNLEELIEIPLGVGKRHEPAIKGKGVPVWALVSYHKRLGWTPAQISREWRGEVTKEEVQAALDYAEKYPWRVDDKLAVEG